MIETLIGQRYRIKALIGEGGMASVYLALDEKLERKVAIKIMHPHLARNMDIRERFLLEARTVSGLDHPNILRVYDFSGLDSEQLWIVMEILYGQDLSEYVKAFPRNRLQFIVATLITREICRALHEAHKLNVVHRDIKPENIMMLQNGQLKLMDFGIAKVHRANATQTGIFMGSPSYMSPEQIRGTDVDSRADIYSLSVLFYEIITGQLPFVGKSTAEVINRIMVGRYTPPNLLIPELPSPLNNVITKGMQHHKEERFSTITEMALALDNFLASINFRESRLELEEFSANRTKFEERVAEVLTVPPTALNVLSPSEVSASFKSKVTRYQASYEGQAPEHPTMLLDEQSAPTVPPQEIDISLNRSLPPLMSVEEPKVPGLNFDESSALYVPQEKEKKAAPNASPSKPRSARVKQSSIPPISGKTPSSKGSGNASPLRNATQAPRTPSSSRATQQRAVFREFLDDEQPKKSSNFGLIVALIIAAAVAIFVIASSDKVTGNRPKMVSKGGESVTKPKKKIEKEPEVPTPAPSAGTPAASDMPDTKTATDDPAPAAVDPTPAEPSPVPPPVVKPAATKSRPAPSVSRPNPKPVAAKPVAENKPSAVTPPPLAKAKDATLASIPTDKAPDDKVPEKPNLSSLGGDKDREKDKEKPSITGPGMLRLAALPAAEVYLDGKMYGTTNDKQFGAQGIKLDAGTYMLRLKRKGYKTEEQAIQIKPGEMRQINVSLTKLAEFVELSIRVNKLPATVTIEEVKNGGRKRELPMVKHMLPINLKPGSYKVNVSHEGESINRTMELTEENKAITFNADFK